LGGPGKMKGIVKERKIETERERKNLKRKLMLVQYWGSTILKAK